MDDFDVELMKGPLQSFTQARGCRGGAPYCLDCQFWVW